MAYNEMYSVWNCVLPWAVADQAKPIIIKEQKEKVQEGSCVTINCNFKSQSEMQLFWIKDPIWNIAQTKFDGIIVYSNTQERPQVSEYSDRVEFLNPGTNTHWATCTLKINHLKKNDSGMYAFRYIKESNKYMSETFNLSVIDNPCKVHIKPLHLNKSLKEGDNVSLHCITSAACTFNPVWKPSDSSKVLSTEDTEEKCSELNLTVSWKDDGKILTCRSSGNHDMCLERSVTLRVEYAPKETTVNEGSDYKDVVEGEGVTISCSSKAHPNAKLTWFKHKSIFSQPGENLILQNMKPEDEGSFYCQAENEHGKENSNDIKINVVCAPKGVSISPNSIELIFGETFTLTCSVQSSNPAVSSYKWYRNGQELYQQQTATFTVVKVTQFHKGTYDCLAINSVGESKSTHSSHVSVKYAPQNTHIQGISNRVKLGNRLDLECITEADPPPDKYFWYFKPENERFYTLLSTTNAYWIEKVAISDAGVYMCCAENPIGRGENSTVFNFMVLYAPKTPNLTMKQIVKENEFYTITCTVESSPQADLMLIRSPLTNTKKDRINLNTLGPNFVEFAGNASVLDAGEYTCEAKNSEGENFSKSHLKVLYAPKNVIATAHPGVEQMEGSNLELTCKADSVPQVSAYTWKKLGHTSGTQLLTVGEGQNITLSSLNSSDSDYYFCIASNNIGSSKSSSMHIRVKYRPHLEIIHNMTSLGLWDMAVPVHLICSVQCYPPATLFMWYKLEENTTVLSHDQTYTVQPENPGTYYCDAQNEVGKSRSKPIKIYFNYFFIKRLIKVIISFVVIILLIGVIFLLQRIILRKRSSGKNVPAQRSFFFSAAPLFSLSNMRSSVSRNNTRENLVMDGSTELSGDNYSPTAVHSNPPANRNKQAGRPNANVSTVYDAIKLPPSMSKQHHHKEEDLTTTVNYAMVQFMGSNNPNKSVPNQGGCEAVYSKVLKNKPMAKEHKGGHEDYENVSGACAPKRPFPNINWDSDSSESEEEVNYTQVSFTATSHHNPQKDIFGLDEEDKIEYSEVKI